MDNDKIELRSCIRCGMVWTRKPAGNPPRYCIECRNEVKRETERQRRREREKGASGTQEFVCTRCGARWTRPTARGTRPKYCPGCRRPEGGTVGGKGTGPERVCEMCGVRFRNTHPRRTCSRSCGQRLSNLPPNAF